MGDVFRVRPAMEATAGRDRAGRAPLHYAVTDGPSDMAFLTSKEPEEVKRRQLCDYLVANTKKVLATGPDANARDDEGFTPRRLWPDCWPGDWRHPSVRCRHALAGGHG